MRWMGCSIDFDPATPYYVALFLCIFSIIRNHEGVHATFHALDDFQPTIVLFVVWADPFWGSHS